MWYLSDAEENRRGFWEIFPIILLFIPEPMGSLHQVPRPAPTERCSCRSQWMQQQERLCAPCAGSGLLGGMVLLGCSEWAPCLLNILFTTFDSVKEDPVGLLSLHPLYHQN